MADSLSPEQQRALVELGLTPAQIERFLADESVAFLFQTESDPGVAVIERVQQRLRCGIVEINDPGGGVKDLLGFRSRAVAVAMAFSIQQIELFGVEVVNRRLKLMLKRFGFVQREVPCPAELGGGLMNILSRVDTID